MAFHRWLSAEAAKNAAVQRRRRRGGVMSGAMVMDEETGATEIRDIGGDAQVCLARGTVVTNAKAVPNEMTDLAGPQCYHQDDYSIFYNNIKANAAVRVAAYKNKTKE